VEHWSDVSTQSESATNDSRPVSAGLFKRKIACEADRATGRKYLAGTANSKSPAPQTVQSRGGVKITHHPQTGSLPLSGCGPKVCARRGSHYIEQALQAACRCSEFIRPGGRASAPNGFDVLGIANFAASVTVNGSGSDYRRGEYCQESVGCEQRFGRSGRRRA
jgi:hypothetical protein